MKIKIYIAILAASCLANSAASTAAIPGYNAVIPLHHRVKTENTQQINHPAMSTMHIQATGINLPDLVIRSASIRLAQRCRVGAPIFYVTASVQNIGNATSPRKMGVGLIQARDSVNNGWGNGHGLPKLTQGQSTTVTFPIYYLQSNPASMLGMHRFNLHLNAGRWIQESNYTNNGFRPVSVVVPRRFCIFYPDITSHRGPRIGGKYVAWGGRVKLGRHNAKRIDSNGMCVFDVVYQMSNDGVVPTKPMFVNRLHDGSILAAVNSNLHLNAGETKSLETEPTFLSGTHVLGFSLDDGNAVKESNENNNRFRVIVEVDKSCRNFTVRPRKPQLFIGK